MWNIKAFRFLIVKKTTVDCSRCFWQHTLISLSSLSYEVISHLSAELIHMPTKNVRIKIRCSLFIPSWHFKMHNRIHLCHKNIIANKFLKINSYEEIQIVNKSSHNVQ